MYIIYRFAAEADKKLSQKRLFMLKMGQLCW